MRTLAVALLMSGCFTRRVETVSQPTTMHLRLAASCDGTVLEQYLRDGYVPVSVTDGVADVSVPEMRGGYSERGNTRSHVNDPYDSEILRLRRGDLVARELSVNAAEKLPKDADGRSIVDCGPPGA